MLNYINLFLSLTKTKMHLFGAIPNAFATEYIHIIGLKQAFGLKITLSHI